MLILCKIKHLIWHQTGNNLRHWLCLEVFMIIEKTYLLLFASLLRMLLFSQVIYLQCYTNNGFAQKRF